MTTELFGVSDGPMVSIGQSLMSDPTNELAAEFNHERFEALVLYIAWKTKDDPEFGRTKLAKVLFYSDLAIYAETGRPLTGAAYVHRAFGPFPPALDSLEEKVQWDVQRYVVDSYIDKIARMGSWKVSDDSHKHPGWLMTHEYEEIPYHVAFMSRRKPSGRDRERVEQLAREHGWR